MATYYRWRRSTIGWKDQIATYATLDGSQTIGLIGFGSTSIAITDDGTKPEISDGAYTLSRTFNYGCGLTLDGKYIAPTNPSEFMYTATGNGGNVTLLTSSNPSIAVNGYGTVYKYQTVPTAGTFVDYVYSTRSTAYPNGNVSGGYYYDQRAAVGSPNAPTGLRYPDQIVGQTVTVSWNAATSNVPDYPVTRYEVSYSANGGGWTVATTTGNTSATISIPGGTTYIRFRVRARDSNNQYGSYVTGATAYVYLPPALSVTPSVIMQGKPVTVTWAAVGSGTTYTLQRKANTDADWVQVYAGAGLTFTENAGTWSSVQYRISITIGGSTSGWSTSASVPVADANTLLISGSDGDLGLIDDDVPYTISTATTNPITATVTVNTGITLFSGTVTSGEEYKVSILDLPEGEGTIHIAAQVQSASGTQVNATRTWTYEKEHITFADAGHVANFTPDGPEGEVVWFKTLAECVRMRGGKSLAEALAYPCQVYIGSYAGTGTYGAENPCVVNLPFKPLAFTVSIKDVGSGNTIYGQLIWLNGNETGGSYLNGSNTGICTLQWGETSVSWYSSAANFQLNVSGYEYQYMAIG